jgi:hypothetical protein
LLFIDCYRVRGNVDNPRVPKFERRRVNRQAFIMIRTAGELGFTPSARASLGMIEEGGRGGLRLIDEVNPFDEFP